jgi:hypothetical protein
LVMVLLLRSMWEQFVRWRTGFCLPLVLST